MSDKPLPRNWNAYRADLGMTTAMRCLDGKDEPPRDVTLDRWVSYLLCSAIQDIAKAIEQLSQEAK